MVAATAGEVANYTPVTQQRLLNPEPGNWLLYRHDYNGQGFSPLKQINAENVKSLVPVWTFSTGVVEGHELPADGEQRRHVRYHAAESGAGAECQDR